MALGRLHAEGDVDDGLAVRGHVRAPDERREAGLRDAHLVRPYRNPHERRHRRRPDGLAVELYGGARVGDAYGEPARLRRELLEPRVDEPLLARPVLRAVRALRVVVRLVGLAEPAELKEGVRDAELGAPAGSGMKRCLVMGQ